MNINIGQTISNEIVEEGEIKKSSFLPVFLGVAEDKVKGRHEEDVGRDEDEERVWGNVRYCKVSNVRYCKVSNVR